MKLGMDLFWNCFFGIDLSATIRENSLAALAKCEGIKKGIEQKSNPLLYVMMLVTILCPSPF